MYDRFYGFSAPPFGLTPDSRFFYASAGHNRAIAHLTYGLSQQEGFVVITGEVGAGKTTLAERLAGQLGSGRYTLGRLVTTALSSEELLRLALRSLGSRDAPGDKAVLLARFEHVVTEHQRAGRRTILIVDEAQNLSMPALEELRMLSNITIRGRASVQTILLGQPQFRAMLASPDLDQLRQRVLASYHLGPLEASEVRSYVEHRLRTAGWSGNPAWDADAFAAVFAHSGGIPRRINTLCSRVLLYGALEESQRITAATVEVVAEELARDLGAAPRALPAPASGPAQQPDLMARLDAIESRLARQGRALDTLLGLLAPNSGEAA